MPSAMARRNVLLPVAVLGALLLAASQLSLLGFVSPSAPSVAPSHSEAPRGRVTVHARGGARGGGPDIDGWIAAVQGGSGGEPTGAIKEYIMKWFWPAADPFTGPGGTPGKKDHKKVLQVLKDCFAQGPAFDRGSSSAGFASVNGETSGVDGSPYTWLVGSMTPGGMYLLVTREFPGNLGVRPLAACKVGEEDKLWSSIDWNVVKRI